MRPETVEDTASDVVPETVVSVNDWGALADVPGAIRALDDLFSAIHDQPNAALAVMNGRVIKPVTDAKRQEVLTQLQKRWDVGKEDYRAITERGEWPTHREYAVRFYCQREGLPFPSAAAEGAVAAAGQ